MMASSLHHIESPQSWSYRSCSDLGGGACQPASNTFAGAIISPDVTMALISSSIRAPYSSTRAARTRPVARLAGPVALSPRGRALSTGVVAAAKVILPGRVIALP
jgi:hypothetical protein